MLGVQPEINRDVECYTAWMLAFLPEFVEAIQVIPCALYPIVVSA